MEDVKENAEPIGWVNFWRPKDAWYSLQAEERQIYFDGYQELKERVVANGATLLGTYKCRGQSSWERFEVWEFPSLEILLEFTDGLDTLEHYLYFDHDHIFGRKYERLYDASHWVM